MDFVYPFDEGGVNLRFYVYLWTILSSSLTFLLSLKILHVFKFIKFSPIGWAENLNVFDHAHPLVKWFILWIFIMVVIAILFALGEFMKNIKMNFMAILLAVLFVWLIEWYMQKTPNIHKFSIPLGVMIAIHLLWILETASYHGKLRSLDSRNKLPKSD